MKKLLNLSALILISCSKGDESQEVQAEDNRPLVERLENSVYGVSKETYANGTRYYRGVQIIKRTTPVPIVYASSKWTTSDGYLLADECDPILRLIYRNDIDESEFTDYVITSNEKDKYSSEWTVPHFSTTGEFVYNTYLKLEIVSSQADKRLQILVELETDEYCIERNGSGQCVNTNKEEIKETFELQLLGTNNNSKCRNI